jgi:Ca2+-binding EF-hand superfamily protein
MVLNEILWAFTKVDKDGTGYSISDQMRRELTKTVPEIDWSAHDSKAYELISLIGVNTKRKFLYGGYSIENMILDAVAMYS